MSAIGEFSLNYRSYIRTSVRFQRRRIAANLGRPGVPGTHSKSDAKQLGSAVTIGFHVQMISRVRRVDILAGSAGDDVWRRMRDGRRVESRRPSDETPERLLSVPETGRRLRLQPSPPKFRERNHVAESTPHRRRFPDVHNGISIARRGYIVKWRTCRYARYLFRSLLKIRRIRGTNLRNKEKFCY